MTWNEDGVQLHFLRADGNLLGSKWKLLVDFAPDALLSGLSDKIEEWLRDREISIVEQRYPDTAFSFTAIMNDVQAVEFKLRWV